MKPPRDPFFSHHRAGRPAFTLLEVLIALALSVVIIGAISMATRLHLVTLQEQSKKIEYKQIARSVLMMISNDLRNAVQYKPIDYTVLEEMAAAQLAQQGPPAGGEETGEEASEEEEEEPDPIALPEEEVQGRPNLFGNMNLLSLDVSRIPRLDEYNSLTRNDVNLQLPADIKTVVYFIAETANTTTQPKFEVISNAAAGGLYRRQIDRSVAAYREENEVNLDLDEFAELIAPEIAQIAFRYFDGEEWQESWDSLEGGGFPPAIEVTVVIDPERMNAGAKYSYGGFNPDTMQKFRLVVSLPTGDPVANGSAP